MTVLPCDPEHLTASLESAASAVRGGGLVVLPTDTVYGIGADAFDPSAVAALLAAKGRGRQMPPPVLVAGPEMLDVLGVDVPQPARDLAARFWPGALTLIVGAQPTLDWDLGETGGTVALRMPDDDVALALLQLTGPLAVSSANRTGQPAATSAQEAAEQLGPRVAVYLDAARSPGGVPSTIVDARTPELRIVREGAIDALTLATVVPHLARELRPTRPPSNDVGPRADGPGPRIDSRPHVDNGPRTGDAGAEPG